jgi:hypothetical protein
MAGMDARLAEPRPDPLLVQQASLPLKDRGLPRVRRRRWVIAVISPEGIIVIDRGVQTGFR